MGFLHVRYDEVGLKGDNRPFFEKKLRKNLSRQLDLKGGSVRRMRGRIVVDTGERDPRECLAELSRVFGVASASPVLLVEKDEARIAEAAVAVSKDAVSRGKKTFKVEVRRIDKSFPIKSVELAPRLGGAILEALGAGGLKVSVRDPEFKVGVEIHKKNAAVHSLGVPGPGGMPVGVSGRGLVLLSGGIDSPVAAWLTLKRGLHADFVYFHSFPYTGEKAKEKVLSLARELSRWAPDPLFLFAIPFAKVQDAIAAAGDEEKRIVVFRRFMYRVAARIAAMRWHKALVTGEALGQVASQTPENLRCVEVAVPGTLVLRPLIGMDKHEIIDRAKAIGTFETSILPYEDCCSIFAPRHPATRATPEECEEVEARLEVGALEEGALAGAEVWRVHQGKAPSLVPGGVKPATGRRGVAKAPSLVFGDAAKLTPAKSPESHEKGEKREENEDAYEEDVLGTDFSEG